MLDHDQQLAEGFDRKHQNSSGRRCRADPAAIARLVREANFPPGGHVLDAGCGPGLVSSGLLDAGLDVVGVDLSTEMIERARKRCVAHGSRRSSFRLRSTILFSINSLPSTGPYRDL